MTQKTNWGYPMTLSLQEKIDIVGLHARSNAKLAS